MRTMIVAALCIALTGCMTFHAKGYTDSGTENWKAASLAKDTPNGTSGHDCLYKVDETGSTFSINRRQHCLDKVEIDINSWKFTTVGIPILLGGFSDSGFKYRPAMP